MGSNTPQRNHLADIAFHVLSNQGQEMMENSKILKNRNYLSWREAFNTSKKLDGFVEVDGITMRRYWHWNKKEPNFANNLHTWGEAVVVTLHYQMTLKLEKRVHMCTFVGYTGNHAHYTFAYGIQEVSGSLQLKILRG
jgi:hypothetical protein